MSEKDSGQAFAGLGYISLGSDPDDSFDEAFDKFVSGEFEIGSDSDGSAVDEDEIITLPDSQKSTPVCAAASYSMVDPAFVARRKKLKKVKFAGALTPGREKMTPAPGERPQGLGSWADDKGLPRLVFFYVSDAGEGKTRTNTIEYIDGLAWLFEFRGDVRLMMDAVKRVNSASLYKEQEERRMYDASAISTEDLSYLLVDPSAEQFGPSFDYVRSALRNLVRGYNCSIDDTIDMFIEGDGNISGGFIDVADMQDERCYILGPVLREVVVEGLLPHVLTQMQIDKVFRQWNPPTERDPMFRATIDLKGLDAKLPDAIDYLIRRSHYEEKRERAIDGINYLIEMKKQ